MAGYVFALGRGGETTLAADAPAGATSLTVTTTGALATGDWVFASWADGWMQWLGRVKLAGAQSLTLTRPLARPLAAGASVWRPEDVIVTPAAAATPLVIEIESGVVHERSAGGEWTAVQCSRPLVTTQLRLEGLTPAVEAMLVEWLARAGWGLLPFTLLLPDATPVAVRLLAGGERPLRRERLPGDRCRLTLPLVIVEEGGYR